MPSFLSRWSSAGTSRKRTAPFWTAERVLVILQCIALICGATWTLLEYFTFGRKSAELEQAIQKETLHELQQGRIASLVKISIKPSEGGQVAVATFELRITNVSKAPVEVSWALLHWYLGSIADKQKEAFPLRLNDPPVAFTGEQDSGPIVWDEGRYVGYLYPGSKAEKLLADIPKKFAFGQGGGPTKILQPGDSSAMEEQFLVKRIAGQWIGIVVTVGLDGEIENDHLFHYIKTIATSDITKPEGVPVLPAS